MIKNEKWVKKIIKSKKFKMNKIRRKFLLDKMRL